MLSDNPNIKRRMESLKRFLLHSSNSTVSDLSKHVLWFLADYSAGVILPQKASFVERIDGITREDIESLRTDILNLLAADSRYSLNQLMASLSGLKMKFFACNGYHDSHGNFIVGDAPGGLAFSVFLCPEPFDPASKDYNPITATRNELVGNGLCGDVGLPELCAKAKAAV